MKGRQQGSFQLKRPSELSLGSTRIAVESTQPSHTQHAVGVLHPSSAPASTRLAGERHTGSYHSTTQARGLETSPSRTFLQPDNNLRTKQIIRGDEPITGMDGSTTLSSSYQLTEGSLRQHLLQQAQEMQSPEVNMTCTIVSSTGGERFESRKAKNASLANIMYTAAEGLCSCEGEQGAPVYLRSRDGRVRLCCRPCIHV
jgi:hypothetical protein